MATVTFDQIFNAVCFYWAGGGMDFQEYDEFCTCVQQALKNNWGDARAASHALRAAAEINAKCKQNGIAL